jgi:hypothetical protein
MTSPAEGDDTTYIKRPRPAKIIDWMDLDTENELDAVQIFDDTINSSVSTPGATAKKRKRDSNYLDSDGNFPTNEKEL